MKKHVYIFSNASVDNHKKITDQGKWDCIAKGQKIRKAVGKIQGEVIKIIASSEPRVIQTADFIADGMHLRNYNMQILHDLTKDTDFEENIEELIKSMKETIKSNVLTIIIVHRNNVDKIRDKLSIKGTCLNEPSVLGGYHFEIEAK